MDRNLYLTRTHIEELLTDLDAVEKWLDVNEPVRAYKGILRTKEHIKQILQELDDKNDIKDEPTSAVRIS